MGDFSDYIIKEKLYISPSTLVLRGMHDHQSVIIKVLKNEHPTIEEIARFKTEYEIINLLKSVDTARAYDIGKYKNYHAMILEDIPYPSLAKILEKKKKFTPIEFLELALPMTHLIGQIHQHNIIHKDINPSNMLCDLKNFKIKVIDFSYSVSLTKEKATTGNINLIGGTLSYLAPEQTGRINHDIDYRTDYYSLGVTFYQMITGQLPFSSTDPVELIHAHIAIIPTSPHVIDPNIPEMLSAIIMKLLSKTAENRYQSTYGLLEDLKKCLAELKSHGKIDVFTLGTKDIFSQFQIPEKLYGRSHEIKSLLDTYEDIMKGKIELMLIAGEPGIGKSSLIREIYKPVIVRSGHFISGKFEQFKQNIPYSALAQAFEDLVKQLLTENEEKITFYKKNIISALGKNGRVMTELVPSLISIIGKQPLLPRLNFTESQNRFSYVLQNFMHAIAGPNNPLVIFLDDLQWADLASLRILEALLTKTSARYLLIIGAYRDNKPQDIQSLLAIVENIKKRTTCNTLTLTSLKLEDVNELIADTLHQDVVSTKSLADICYKKTAGNPFFLSQLLQTLYKENLIEFDVKKNAWIWFIDKIEQKNITDNVVQLTIEKINKLSPQLQSLLPIAACIGGRFNLKILMDIIGNNNYSILQILDEAQSEGLIYKIGSEHGYSIYQFVHDRIRQAAYALLSKQDKIAMQIKIGRLILEATDKENIENSIFKIIDHYNVGIDYHFEFDATEKQKIAELNLVACKAAKASAAFEPALNYAQHSLRCIDEETWIKHYDFSFEAYLEAVDNAYLSGQYELMEQYMAVALDHVNNLYDQIKINRIQMLAYIAQEKHERAIDILMATLPKLGIKWIKSYPRQPGTVRVITAVLHNKYLLLGKKIPDLVDLPEITDQSKKMAMNLLILAGPPLYFTNPNLFAVLLCLIIRLALKYGHSAQAASAYSAYSIILCGHLGEIETGYQFGELSINLLDKYNEEDLRTRIMFVLYTYIRHWKDKIKDITPLLIENFENGMADGDLEFASYSLLIYIYFSYITGQPLDDLNDKIAIYKPRLESTGNTLAICSTAAWHQGILNLINGTENHGTLTGSECNETTLLDKFADNKLVLFYIYINKLMLNYLFGNYAEANKDVIECHKNLNAIGGMPLVITFNFFQSLLFAQNSNINNIKKIIKNQKSLKKWTDYAPYNNAQKYFLIEAELARIRGETKKAMALYDKALELAKQNEFLNDEALINELAGKFYLSFNMNKIAKTYLRDARLCYLSWGAKAKVAQLEKDYSLLSESEHETINVLSSYTSTSLNKAVFEKVLDIHTILKSAELVSSTIIFPSLLKRLMRVLIENVGAQKGFLLLNQEGQFFIEAEGNIEIDEVTILQSIAMSDQILPETVINYVINTKEPVVIENAVHSNRFMLDPYITKMKPKSILCAPILHHQKFTGILYFENNLVVGAFTPERLEVLKILSGQAATSIENARLYDASERFVPKEFLKLLHKESILNIKLGDSVSKRVTAMFTDIRNYTTLIEKQTAKEAFAFINSYLKYMSPIIHKNQGFILQYLGDAILALFPDQPENALNAALEMHLALKKFNKHREKENKPPIKVGYGINTGDAMLGLIGEKNRMDPNVISDAINLASRIESLNKMYGTQLLTSNLTFDALKEPAAYNYRMIDKVKVKGKSQAIFIYEILPNKDGLQEQIQLFAEAFQTYQKSDFSKAVDLFSHYLTKYPDDEPAKILQKRCRYFIEGGKPENWDGSFTMLSK